MPDHLAGSSWNSGNLSSHQYCLGVHPSLSCFAWEEADGVWAQFSNRMLTSSSNWKRLLSLRCFFCNHYKIIPNLHNCSGTELMLRNTEIKSSLCCYPEKPEWVKSSTFSHEPMWRRIAECSVLLHYFSLTWLVCGHLLCVLGFQKQSCCTDQDRSIF